MTTTMITYTGGIAAGTFLVRGLGWSNSAVIALVVVLIIFDTTLRYLLSNHTPGGGLA